MAHLVTVAGHTPDISRAAFVAPNAVIAGDVMLGEGVSIWYGVVIRAEMAPVVIGDRTNVQDNSVIHTDLGFPTTIGADVTLGHRALVHGATVEDGVLVGMGAIVLNGAVVGAGGMVAAGAVVLQGTQIEPRKLTVGVPAKVRNLPSALQPPWPNVEGYSHLASLYAEADPA